LRKKAAKLSKSDFGGSCRFLYSGFIARVKRELLAPVKHTRCQIDHRLFSPAPINSVFLQYSTATDALFRLQGVPFEIGAENKPISRD